ncbi:hypothetical protein GOBAR_DD03631 [Gossypium barbadense]|nr:hypothetical protein GOBAR_DD03631 [Gossypium barbadense]
MDLEHQSESTLHLTFSIPLTGETGEVFTVVSMGTGKEDTAIFLDRASRSTRGKRGLPFWLHDVLGIVFRSGNGPFKFHMQKWVRKVVNMMKSEKLYASQGGPIILSQIENEYQRIESAFNGKGSRYVQWAAGLADDSLQRLSMEWKLSLVKMDAIHTFTREGELDKLLKCIESGVSVHLQENKCEITRSRLRFYSFESDSLVEKKPNPVIESTSVAEAHVKDVALPVGDVSNKELKTRIKKYFEGDEEALLSVLKAILQRKLAGKHEETDDELMDELEVQPRDDVDDEEFESDFDNLYSTDEEILAILAMFLMK